MMTKILGFETHDVRFPTSRTLDGSDAMNPGRDYSAAYLVIRTDDPDGLAGHALRVHHRPGATTSSSPRCARWSRSWRAGTSTR